jgi:N-hydroxyarylamine O-acetyltransferase
MSQTSFDLEAYLARIGYAYPRVATLQTLSALHERHLAAIPFENLDVRLGRPIKLDRESLQAKLVGARRGGYCFEQNTLFAAALYALGFEVDTLEARVRLEGVNVVLPRTHMILRVPVAEGDFLADVGFGGDGPLRPVPLSGEVVEQPIAAYRVAREGKLHVLQRRRGATWTDQYAFGLEPALPIDYEVANHYTATWPSSPFVNTVTTQRSTAEARHILRGHTYTVQTAEGDSVRQVPTEEALRLIREVIGIELPEEDLRQALGEPV